MEGYWITISATILPLVGVCYLGSFFSDPSSQDKRTITILTLHFLSFSIVGQGSWFIYEIKKGEMGGAMTHVARALLEVFFFRVGLKIRRGIGQLPPNQLHDFLVNTLFKGGITTTASVLFITFRGTKCVFERNLEECTNTALCSSFISLFIILNWWLQLVRCSVPKELRREIVLSIERLVHMDVNFMQLIQLASLAVCGACGIWLFAMMNSAKQR